MVELNNATLIPCPVCGSEEQLVAIWGGFTNLIRCQRCGVGYVAPLTTPSSLKKHFDSATVSAISAENASSRGHILERIARKIQTAKPDGKILDVGCADGSFLAEYFPTANWELYGAELSHRVAAQAEARGINVRCGTVGSAGFEPGSFDVITVLDTLYYFSDPREDLAEVRKILKPDGVLVVELPYGPSRIWRMTSGLGRKLSRQEKGILGSDHLFYYTPRSAEVLLGECGFQVEKIVPLPANRHRGWRSRLAYGMYGAMAFALWGLSFGTVRMTPRFLMIGKKANSI